VGVTSVAEVGYMRTVLAALVLLTTSSAMAQPFPDTYSGNDLLSGLDACEEHHANYACGYALGRIDGIAVALNLLEFTKIPESATRSQLVDIIKKYLTAHPQERQEIANVLIFKAISEVFPYKVNAAH
jgi:hypothetical protein